MNLHALTEALYLAAAILATFGLAIRQPRLSRAAVGALAAGALMHAAAFLQMHEFKIPPRLTGLPGAVSLAAWLGTLFFLALLSRPRFDALVVIVAPAAFLGAFFGSMGQGVVVHQGAPLWAQAHVLLASAGIALLGVAGAAGLLYLAQHRSLKRKTAPLGRASGLPPLEALDRVNALAVSAGFLLLSLALVTGVLWTLEREGRPWPSSPHATGALVAWTIYAVLVGARWLARQGAMRSAQTAVAGFAVLLAAVVGVGMLR